MKYSIAFAFLTLCCLANASVYDDFAAKTGGTVYRFQKSAVAVQAAQPLIVQAAKKDIMPPTSLLIPFQKTQLNQQTKISFLVDKSYSRIWIHLQGANRPQSLMLINPEKKFSASNFPKNNTNMMTTVFFVDNIMPGEWSFFLKDADNLQISIEAYREIEPVDLIAGYPVVNQPVSRMTRIQFPVDDQLTDLSMKITGEKVPPEVNVISPDPASYAPSVFVAGNALLITLTKPTPGLWTIETSGAPVASFQIQAKSYLYFLSQNIVRLRLGREGFFYFPYTGSIRSGSTETFELTFVDPTQKFIPMEMQAVSLGGKILASADTQVQYRLADSLLIHSKLKIPNEPFRILVTGRDGNGNACQRLGAYLYELNQARPRLTP